MLGTSHLISDLRGLHKITCNIPKIRISKHPSTLNLASRKIRETSSFDRKMIDIELQPVIHVVLIMKPLKYMNILI